jgi:hypothetical protein
MWVSAFPWGPALARAGRFGAAQFAIEHIGFEIAIAQDTRRR